VPHAASRPSLSATPQMHRLRLPPTTIVPLSASERQSGVVLAAMTTQKCERILFWKNVINLTYDPLGPLDYRRNQRFGPRA
jgi:hypothetical protein